MDYLLDFDSNWLVKSCKDNQNKLLKIRIYIRMELSIFKPFVVHSDVDISTYVNKQFESFISISYEACKKRETMFVVLHSTI